jgi:hypothetical protein
MEDDEKQAAALSQKIAECSRNSSSFITSGNAAPFRNVPKPVVEDDPRATMLNAPPACSLGYKPDLLIWQIGTNDVVWRGKRPHHGRPSRQHLSHRL